MMAEIKYTKPRSFRLVADLEPALSKYANDHLLSINAAINILIWQRLKQKGYIQSDGIDPDADPN
jgi:hypothetical protein